MALVFTSVAQACAQNGVKTLVYGRSGAGKTSLIPTAPRPVIFSAESGLLSIKKIAPNALTAVIGSIKDLLDAWQWCQMAPEARNYDTVFIDSISEVAEKLLSDEKKKSKDPRQAYGEMQDQIATHIRSFRDLKQKHVCLLAKLEQRTGDAATQGGAFAGPSMPGNKTGQGLAYYFDEVFMLGVADVAGAVPRQTYRFLQTQPDTVYEAKDRSGCLETIEEPHLGKIFAKIMQAA